jgi:uncharacterized protein involved in outer membrane biogenesis
MAKFLKIFLTALGILVLIFAGGYVYIFHAGGIEKFVVSKIDTSFGEKYNLKITIGEIEGDLLSGVVLRNVIISYHDSVKEFNLAEIPRLEAHYSLSGLLSGNYYFSLVQIDSARFFLITKDSGGWYLPPLAPGGYSAGDVSLGFLGSISNLQVNDASCTLVRPKDTINFSDINLAASLEAEGETYAADLERLSFNSDQENYELDHGSGKITIASGIISFQDGSIGRGASRLKLNGQFDVKQFLGKVNLAADNLDMNEISRYGGLNLHGQLDINGNFDLDRSGIKGSLDLAGDLEILEFRNLHVDLRFVDKHLYLDSIYGTVLDKCAIDGKGEIDFSSETEKYELRSTEF